MRKPSKIVTQSFSFSTEATSTTAVSSIAATTPPLKRSDDVIRDAIKNHLRYLRAMGKMHVSAQDVARALSLSVGQVKQVAVQVGATLED